MDAGLDDVLIITRLLDRPWRTTSTRNPQPLERTLFTKNDHDRLASVVAAAELAKVHYVRQRTTRPGHAVLCADMHVGEEPFTGPARRRPDRRNGYVLEQMLAVREEFGGGIAA